MKWLQAREHLPKHNEEVLVRCRGIFNLAVYNNDEKKFQLKDGSFYYVETEKIEWVGLVHPEHKP